MIYIIKEIEDACDDAGKKVTSAFDLDNLVSLVSGELKFKIRFQVVVKWLQIYHPGYASIKVEKSS